MAKKSRSRKGKGRTDERFPNYVHACEPLIIKHVIRPAVLEVLTDQGARSLSDLHAKLQNYLQMSISLAAFSRFMVQMPDLKNLFTRQQVIKLNEGPQGPEGPQTAPPASEHIHEAPPPPPDDPTDDGLREGLAPPPGGRTLPADLPPRQDWDLSSLGLSGGSAPVGF